MTRTMWCAYACVCVCVTGLPACLSRPENSDSNVKINTFWRNEEEPLLESISPYDTCINHTLRLLHMYRGFHLFQTFSRFWIRPNQVFWLYGGLCTQINLQACLKKCTHTHTRLHDGWVRWVKVGGGAAVRNTNDCPVMQKGLTNNAVKQIICRVSAQLCGSRRCTAFDDIY